MLYTVLFCRLLMTFLIYHEVLQEFARAYRKPYAKKICHALKCKHFVADHQMCWASN